MESFKIDAIVAGKPESLLIIPVKVENTIIYRLMMNGLELSVLKTSGSGGWEVSGTPLNAEELNSIGTQIRNLF